MKQRIATAAETRELGEHFLRNTGHRQHNWRVNNCSYKAIAPNGR